MIDKLIYTAFTRHINHNHNAEYEVCHHLLCIFAYFIERIFREDYNQAYDLQN